MEPLAKLLVSLVELAETELAMLKSSIVKLALSLAMIVGGAIFGVIGICWVLYAIFLWLIRLTNVPTAYLISGVAFVAIAGILVVMAFSHKEQPKVAAGEHAPGDPGEGKSDDSVNLRIAS